MTEPTADKLTPAELSLLAILIRNQITPSGVARDWNDIKNFGHIATVWRSRTTSKDTDEQVRELGYDVMRQAIKMGLLQKDKGGQESWVEHVSSCTNGRDLRDALASGPEKSSANLSGHATKGKGKGRANKKPQATTTPQQESTATSSNQTHDTTREPGPANERLSVDSSTRGVKTTTSGPQVPPLSSNTEKTAPVAPHRPDVSDWLKIYPAEGAATSDAQSSAATSSSSNAGTNVLQNLMEQTQLLGLVAMGKLGPDGQQRLKKLQEEYRAAMKGATGSALNYSL